MEATSQWVLPFEQISAADLPSVGGKGANLGEMTRAGFPIPPGFCITTAAFDAFMAAQPGPGGAADAGADVFGALDTLAPGDVEAVRAAGAAIRARLVARPVPLAVTAAVRAAWEAAGVGHAYAVRSSATAEDLPDASFAGQQDTYLNVRGGDALVEAVRACWASLFTDRAILYRMQNGFDHRHVKLSVVVQRMIEPAMSGILFTADPLTGHRHVTSIDAGFGLGEALVSGIVSADLYRVDARTDRLIEATVGDKPIAIRSLPEGGTLRETLSDAQRHAQVLSEPQVVALARLGRRVAAHYGKPQDIEWCIDAAGDIFIVQSRPITSLYPLPDPPPGDDALHVYLSFSHVQVMTDPIPPMGRSVLRTLLPIGKLDRPRDETQFMAAAGGRLYVDLTPMLVTARARHALPRALSIADQLIADAVGEVVRRPEFTARLGRLHRRIHPLDTARFVVPVVGKALRWLWGRPPESAVPFVEARMAAVLAMIDRDLAASGPPAARLRVAQTIVGSVFATHVLKFLPVIAGGMVGRLMLVRLTGDPVGVDAILRGLHGNATTAMDLEVGDLADLARRHPAVVECLTSRPPAAALAAVGAVEGGPDFLAALQAFVDRYGMRGPSEIDITRPRWGEDPAPLIQVVVGSLQHATGGTHRVQHARQVADGEAAVARLVASARRGRFGAARSAAVGRLARAVRGLLAAREHPKFLLVQVLGRVKRVILAAGADLVAAGRLDAVEDVWFLGLGELAEAIESPGADLRARVAERRAEHLRFRHLRPPRVMTSDGEIPHVAYRRSDLPPGALPGSPASAGTVEGIARVVLDPTTEVLSPGEILVAPFTDPGWTPLFINAAGLVMEVGGLMTHGSVVAREYGIPAVVGVLDATRLLRTGQRVRVDGDRGCVEVLGDEGAAEA